MNGIKSGNKWNMNSNIFRIIVLFIVLLSLPLSMLDKKTIRLETLAASNIKIYFSKNIEIENFKTYKNGIGCYAVLTEKEANKFLPHDCYDGISFESALSYENVLKKLNAKIVSTQKIDINNEKKTIIYAFSNNFSKFLIINSKKVNIQIAVDNEKTTVGLPLLLGSY